MEDNKYQYDENKIVLTIPEGFNIEDIATRVEEKGICTKDEFLNAVKSYPLPSYVKNNPDKRFNLEGFLFPDTYNFEIGVKPIIRHQQILLLTA